MESRLRLAEARGSLTAPNSPVQDLALQILMLLKTKTDEERKVDGIRAAILVADPTKEEIRRVYPEYFPTDAEEAFADAYDEHGEFDIDRVDDSKIDWATEVTPEEDEDLSRWIAERERGQVTLAELDGWR